MRRKPIAPEYPFRPCGNCASGWVMVRPVRWRPSRHTDGAVAMRCACWKAHQAKIQPTPDVGTQG